MGFQKTVQKHFVQAAINVHYPIQVETTSVVPMINEIGWVRRTSEEASRLLKVCFLSEMS